MAQRSSLVGRTTRLALSISRCDWNDYSAASPLFTALARRHGTGEMRALLRFTGSAEEKLVPRSLITQRSNLIHDSLCIASETIHRVVTARTHDGDRPAQPRARPVGRGRAVYPSQRYHPDHPG